MLLFLDGRFDVRFDVQLLLEVIRICKFVGKDGSHSALINRWRGRHMTDIIQDE